MLMAQGHNKACITFIIATGTVQLTNRIANPVTFGDIGFLPAVGADHSHCIKTVCNGDTGV